MRFAKNVFRIAGGQVVAAGPDLALGILFLAAFLKDTGGPRVDESRPSSASSHVMRSIALGFLRIAVVTQFVWILIERYRFHMSWSQLLYPTLVSVGFDLLAVAPKRLLWLPAPLRIFIGVAFTGAICDRLGLFGGPGTPGVSWGNFKNFVAYTAQVNSFFPGALIPSLAAIESIVEGTLGAAMILGFGVRNVTLASAALLCCLGLAMTISLGFASQFPYAVFVLTAGALVLATLDTSSRWSVDAFFLRLRRRWTESAHGKAV